MFPQKQSDDSFTNPTSKAIAKPLFTENSANGEKDGVLTRKPGHLMFENT